jgi:hypothetical protein
MEVILGMRRTVEFGIRNSEFGIETGPYHQATDDAFGGDSVLIPHSEFRTPN